MLSLPIFLSLVAIGFAQDTNVQTVDSSLTNNQVIPDVLPSNFTARFPIEVAFTDSSNNTVAVTAGVNLTMAQTANPPNFAIFSNNTMIIGKPYLIAIVDPDAPSPPNRTQAQFLHFLGKDYVSNALTNNTLFILANQTPAITEFFPPTPPNGSIAHRYVVAMYLQAQLGVTLPSGFNATNRTNFNLTTFAEEVPGLTLLGATFFFVGPGNSTNSTATSTASGAGASSTSPTGSGSGALANAPATWSVLASMLGLGLYTLGL